jgi:hypothetical protein
MVMFLLGPRLIQVKLPKLFSVKWVTYFLVPMGTDLHVERIHSINGEGSPLQLGENAAEETLDSWRNYVHL